MQCHGFNELVRRAQTGQREASEQLFVLVRPWLQQMVRRYRADDWTHEDEADVLQIVSLQVWQKLGQFRGATGDQQTWMMFLGWLRALVHRQCLNAMRDEGRRRRRLDRAVTLNPASGESHAAGDQVAIDPADSDLTPGTAAQVEEEAQLVQAAIGRIADPLARQVVRLRFADGHSLREIAGRLGIDYGAVRKAFHVGMASLAEDLARLDQSSSASRAPNTKG